MAEQRAFPPSQRRSQLARRAGVVAASPQVVTAATWIAALAITGATARATAARLDAWITAACNGAHDAPDAGSVAASVVVIVTPVVALAALAAMIAHVAQTRAVWVPRRRVTGAPALPRDAAARGRRAGFETVAALGFAGVTFGWLWRVAPRLATLGLLDHGDRLASAAALLGVFAATLAIAWVAVGVTDAIARVVQHAAALRMTAAEKSEDDRVAAADPRWQRRRSVRHSDAVTAMRGATLLVLGDGVAAAISWDPIRRPVPTRVAAARDARATQLLALARRHGVAIHRDPELALALTAGDDGAVATSLWPRLADVVAAIRGRDQAPP